MVVVISKWPKWLEHILQKEYLILPYEDQWDNFGYMLAMVCDMVAVITKWQVINKDYPKLLSINLELWVPNRGANYGLHWWSRWPHACHCQEVGLLRMRRNWSSNTGGDLETDGQGVPLCWTVKASQVKHCLLLMRHCVHI
jgi:hypothetical protein